MASKDKIINYDSSYGFGLPQDVRRGVALPLDHSSVQLSLSDAQEYAKNDPTAYVGQIISVYEGDKTTAYIISNEQGDLVGVGSGDIDKILQRYVIKEELESHIENRIHITPTERIVWNNKLDQEEGYQHINDTDIHVTAQKQKEWDAIVSGNPGLKGLSVKNNKLYFNDKLVSVNDGVSISENDMTNSIFSALDW